MRAMFLRSSLITIVEKVVAFDFADLLASKIPFNRPQGCSAGFICLLTTMAQADTKSQSLLPE
jgi:hypothetical protein